MLIANLVIGLLTKVPKEDVDPLCVPICGTYCNGKPMRILIADDNPVCVKVLENILKQYGECKVVLNGKEAVQSYADSINDPSQRFDLVCLDIMMPQMSGREALDAIRAIEAAHGLGEREGVKIMMMTAVDSPLDVLSSFSSGCEAYLVKPIDRVKITNNLRTLSLVPSQKAPA